MRHRAHPVAKEAAADPYSGSSLVPMLVALSGALTGPDDEARARAAGFNYFIVKSSDSSELVGLIDRIAAADGPPAAA